VIREKDNGAAELLLRFKRGVRCKVGLVGPAAAAAHPKGRGLSAAEIGVFHEFGTDTIPARSFVRATVDEEIERTRGLLRRIATAVLRGVAPQRSARSFGERMVKAMIARINSNIPPPLSPVTIKRKGHDLALVDTGTMRDALSYEVEVIRG
jgi:hypothetical protein